MNLSSKFVFFRYPNSEKRIFSEGSGEEQFVFTDFEDKENITILGNHSSYQSDYPTERTSLPQTDFFIINQEEYARQIDVFLRAFAQKGISKAILSRILKIELFTENLHDIFNALCDTYPKAMIYVAQLGERGIWAGASPERLIQYDGKLAQTVALAGTKKTNNQEDWGDKERSEHRTVEQYIERIGEHPNFKLINKSEVYLQKAGKVYHQKSDFTFQIKEENIKSFLSKLHPTPAVCGTPLDKSKALILETETHKRRLYTGYFGLIPDKGAFELFVNLRCLQIQGKTGYLYLGGGITPLSIMEDEWQETIDKSMTLLSVLGI